jgi:crotonobetainyl-CoA:carnitine CoA-transferase CaiB-like acyl-CoA transferase
VSEHAKALSDVRVLTLGAFIAGHTAGMLLAELGADVVQIESRHHPEVLRQPAYGYGIPYTEPSGIPVTVLHAGLARSTRGLALDMTTAPGRELFLRLVAVSDVVIENLSPSVMRNWGLGFEQLASASPQLVMLSLSGYGRTGPRAPFRAFASNIANFVGLTAAWGTTHGTHTDYVTAVHGALAVLAALEHSENAGEAVYLDVAQMEAAAALMAPLYLDLLANRRDGVPPVNAVPGSVLAGVYPALGHDRWLAVELEDLDDWNTLCRAVERPDLRVEHLEETEERRQELSDALAAWSLTLPPHAAAHHLQLVGIAAGAVQDSDDIARDPQLRSRGYMVEIDHPDIGVLEFAESPVRMSKTPGHVQRRAPRLGEHTGEVLREWLDVGDDEVTRLVEVGAAWDAPRTVGA